MAITLHGQTKQQSPAPATQAEKPEVYEQVIRIKFNPEQTAQLDALLTTKANAQGVLNSQEAGPLQTGFSTLDKRNAQYEAKGMRRVFRPAGKFEARHREWGLHLWYEIRFSGKAPVTELMSAYGNVDAVEIAEPVFKYSLRGVEGAEPLPYVGLTAEADSTNDPAPASVPNDPRYSQQWGFDRINAPQAWDIETGDPRVVVAIEDQGVDYNHPDLDGRMWTNPGEVPNNGSDDDNNGYVDDYYGYNFGDNRGQIAIGSHGTHVGGTVAAETNNGTGVSGTAGGWGDNQGVRLMSLSVFGANSQGGFDEAFVYAADNGAVISQNSWGGGGASAAMENAIDYFTSTAGGSGQAMSGGLAIFAAGNDNSSSPSVGYPASYPPAVAVASITSSNTKSSFSNYGSWVDISAPGSNIMSTYPNGGYNSISGTSMACPHVSGVAALVVSQNYGNITSAGLRNILQSTASDVYADNPSYQGLLGSGVVDAYAALSGGGTPPPPPSGYCTSGGNNSSYEWIARVNAGSFSNTSGAAGYSDFTSQTIDLAAGSSNAISLTPGFSGSTYNEYWRVWIDYNDDGDFSDSGELAFDAGSLSNTTVNGSINVPASAEGVTTRMRVSMKYNGTQSACETFSYGEVEDYTVSIGSGSTPPPANYCASRGNSTNYEWIDYVALNGLARTSGADGGYYDGTSQSATVVAGSSNTLYVSAGFSGSSYTEFWRIWIDLNGDGDFTDSGERLVSGSSSSSATLSATLNIPSSARLGSTRMRVSMKYNAAPGSCETFSYGEVEDYTVNITNTSVASVSGRKATSAEMLGNEEPKALFAAYPNPANNKLTISTVEETGFEVGIFDLSGKRVKAERSDRNELNMDISDLKVGIYFIKAKGERETTTLRFVKE